MKSPIINYKDFYCVLFVLDYFPYFALQIPSYKHLLILIIYRYVVMNQINNFN